MQVQQFPFRNQVLYAFGMMGWSIMINLISVILVYLYAPPSNSGIPLLISQVTIFGIFNIISLVTAGSRITDAAWDPFIAQWSDRSKNKSGRRTPFMKAAILPSMIFCFLVFHPLSDKPGTANVVWLVFTLIVFYISSTTYIIPYNALLPELAPRSKDKVRLSTCQSLGYVSGIALASNAFNIANLLQYHFHVASRLLALQYTVAIFALLAGICLAITAWSIDEKK